jgi:hypothetical protein
MRSKNVRREAGGFDSCDKFIDFQWVAGKDRLESAGLVLAAKFEADVAIVCVHPVEDLELDAEVVVVVVEGAGHELVCGVEDHKGVCGGQQAEVVEEFVEGIPVLAEVVRIAGPRQPAQASSV